MSGRVSSKVVMPSATSGNQDMEIMGIFGNKTDDPECMWDDYFAESDKKDINDISTLLGTISILLLSWIVLQRWFLAMIRNVSLDTSNLFYVYVTALYMRLILPFATGLLNVMAPNWPFYCEKRATMETFLMVFEVELLTHMCIERYVVAKYINNGWKIRRDHYIMYIVLCVFFALLYSHPTLYLGLGRYAKDFTCEECILDMVLPNSWQKYYVLAVFFLRSVKPAIFMITMLVWAHRLYSKMDDTKKYLADIRFTKFVLGLTVVNLACWTPLCLIRGWVIISQLVYASIWIQPRFYVYIKWAMVWFEMSPLLSSLTIVYLDKRIFGRPDPAENRNEVNREHQE